MNKKSLIKVSAVGIIFLVLLTLLFFLFMPFISNASQLREKYSIGEDIKINLEEYNNYTLKIITPSNVFLETGNEKSILFRPEEIGNYSVIIISENKSDSFMFEVVGLNNTLIDNEGVNTELRERVEINKPVKFEEKANIAPGTRRTKIDIPSGKNISIYKYDVKGKKKLDSFSINNNSKGISVILSNIDGDVRIEYYTEGPKKLEKEINRNKKEVIVYSSDGIDYNNVTAYTEISENLNINRKGLIKIYWKEENKYLDFIPKDTNNNGLIDYVEWVVPHLSNQTFEIIAITKAEHLDSNRNFISDIYRDVRALDNNWSEAINENEYVRVTFEENLTSKNDITIYPRVIFGNPKIEVYAAESDDKITEFSQIISNDYNKVYLTGLNGTEDNFDLKVVGGSLSFDYIVDPAASFVDGSATGTISTIAGAPTTLASVSSSIPGGTNLVLAAVQVLSTDVGSENIAAGALKLNSDASVLASNEYNLSVSTANLNNNYFIMGVDSGAPAGTSYSVTAYSSATAVNTEAKITVISGIQNWGFNDSETTAFAAATETVLATVPTLFTAGDNVIIASVQIDNGATAQDIPAGGIKIKNGNSLLASNQYELSLGNTAPTDKQNIVILALDSGASANSIYNVTITGAQAGIAEAKAIVFRVNSAFFVDSGSVDLPATTANIASLTTTFAAGSDVVVIAAGQINDTDNNVETLAANTYILAENGVTRSANELTMSAFAASGSAGDGIRHTLIWRNSSSPANPIYRLNATASATGLRAEGKILALQISAPDSINPQISIKYPENAGNYSENISNLNYIYLDTNPNSCKYSNSSGTWNSSSQVPGTNWTNVISNEGSNTWTIYCNDTAGNTNSSTVTFFKDSIYPQIFYGAGTLLNNSNVSQNFIYVNVSVNETNEANITFRLYNDTDGLTLVNSTTLGAGNRTINWTGLSDGHYFYNVSLTDFVNQANRTGTYRITLDTNAPFANLSLPLNNTYTNVTTQNLSVNASDNLELKNLTLYVFNETNDLINQTDSDITGIGVDLGIIYNFLYDGIFKWFYKIFDIGGNSAYTENYTITIDSAYPLLEFGDGTNSSGTNASRDWIYINVSVNETNEANITFRLYNDTDGLTLVNSTTLGAGNRTINWTLVSNGIYYYNVSMFDKAGQINYTETREITLDTTPPNIAIDYPEPFRVFTRNTSLALNVSATDNLIGLSSCWWIVDDGDINYVNCNENTTFNASDGEHVIYYYSNDTLNNTAYSYVSFSVSTLGPAITLEYPEISSYLNFSADIQFNYTPRDPDGVDTCKFYGNWLGGWSVKDTDFSIENYSINTFLVSSIAEGNYIWNIWCNDTNNLESYGPTNFTFTIDAINPLISFGDITSPSGANVSRNWIYVNVSVNETNEANITFYLFNDTNGATLVNSTIFYDLTRTINWTNLADAFYFYNATIYDSALHYNFTDTRNILIDTIYPQILYGTGTLSNNSNVSQNFIYVNVSVNETNEANITFYLFNDTDGLTLVNSTTLGAGNRTINWTGLSDGHYFYNATVVDIVNQANTTYTYKITLDTNAPFANLSLPLNNTYTNVTTQNLSVNASDNLELKNLTLYVFNETNDLINQTYSDITGIGVDFGIIYNFLYDGIFKWLYKIFDIGGNSAYTENYTITIDSIKPKIEFGFGTSENYSNVSRDWIYINVSVNETNEANITFRLYNDTDGLTLVNSTTLGAGDRTINWTLLSNGIYYYNVSLFDKAGQINFTETREISLDTINPLIDFGVGTYNNGNYSEQKWVYANVSVNEINEEKISFSLYYSNNTLLNQTNYTDLTRAINWTDVDNANLTYYYNISVYDYSGNFNFSQTRTIKLIDISPPYLEIVEPQNTSYDTNETLAFDYIANDLHLANCSYSLNGGGNITLDNCQNITIDVPEGNNILYIFANDTLGQMASANVTFIANNSLIFTDDYYVERGSASVDGQTNIVINKTDRTKSFIIYNVRGSSAPNAVFVSAKFFNSSMLQFENYGGAITVDWELITGPDIAVQRGEISYNTSNSSFTAGINSVNLSNSFIIVNTRLNSSVTTDYTDGLWVGNFLNTNTLNFTRLTNGAQGNLSWQVISWTGANVQNTSSIFTTVSAAPSITNAVNTSNSFVIFSYACSGTQLRHYFVEGILTSPNNVLFARNTASGTVNANAFVVEWNRLLTQRNTYNFGAANSNNITINSLYNSSKSFRYSSDSSAGTGSTNANSLVTSAITNQTNLSLQKSSTGQINNVSWQVIELIELDPPVVDLIYPYNNSNFSSFDADSFNYTVNDSSSINNCSLYGNWSTGWHKNQTVNNPEKLVNQNFSSINTGTDGYYIWNVQCIDLYGNVGTNSTNLTFAAFMFPDKPLLFNITQTNKIGTGNITLIWNSTNHTTMYKIYYSNNLSDFVYLNETSLLNYTDTGFSGNKRRFYRVDSWNPSSQNSSENYFGVHVYYLAKTQANTQNWISFPANFSYLNDANTTLMDITNATAFTMWNETIQKRVTCNLYSCPDSISCTDSNCNFNFSMYPGRGYEVSINSSAPDNVNWSGVGIVNNPVTLNLNKNITSYGKNWISLNANTSLGYAKNLFNNITNAEVLTKWNSSSQTSIPFMRSPWNPLIYLGKNFSLSIEEGYEVSVNATTTWTQN